MSMGFEHWIDDGNQEWLNNEEKKKKSMQRYEQVLGGGYMERRDYRHNLNISEEQDKV